ncbi:MAG: hypothetical protein D8M59_07205 [Planctomycetes bacterium]|nr:hypothetical protein [Planctomycetota bacterium]
MRRGSAPAFSSGAMTLVAFVFALMCTTVLLAVGLDVTGQPTPLLSTTMVNAKATLADAVTEPSEINPAPLQSAEGTPDVTGDATSPATILYFDGRPVRPVKTIHMKVTAYSPDARSCAPFDDGITASGYSVWTNGMKLIAADRRYKFGTLLSVPGYNGSRPTPVLDRGAAIKGNRLDVLFPTHREAMKWGRQDLAVTIWEYVDEDPA